MSAGASGRRLAAILAADVVGYSRLTAADEPGTLAKLANMRSRVIEPQLAAHGGRLFKTAGDGLLAEFPSDVRAVQCAIAIQLAMRADAGQQMLLRIGLHCADVVVQPDGDVLGDGVNVAARLEALAEPGGICISGRVREDAAGKLPLEVDDLGERELKNIAQRHRVFRIRLDPPERPTLALPDRPSLAVLPFQNMSGDPEQEYFSDGIVEDITTALSRIGGLFVIARNSSFTYKGRAVDVKQVGRELGVRYVLEGSVRKAGGRIRITCQLIDAATGAHIWADRFDSTLDDVFELQDRVTESVTGAIEPSLRRAEIMRAAALPTKSLDAYDLYLHSLANYYTQTKASFDAAAEMLRRAIEIDPKYALAKAFLALIAALRTVRNWTEPGDQETAIAMAREAIAGGQNDPTVLRAAGHALGRFREYDAALTAVSRAVRLNPNSAEVLGSAAWVHCYACEPEPAIEYLNRAIRLSPLDPEMLMFLAGLGLAYLIAGRATEAHATLLRAVKEGSSWGAWRFLVMAMVELGEIEDAKREALRYLAFNPTFRISTFVVPWRDRTFCERFVAALRKAGLPE